MDPRSPRCVGALPERQLAAGGQLPEHRFDESGSRVVLALLPGKTGLDMHAKIQELNLNIPTIFMTGQDDMATTVKAMQQGAYDYLAKPIVARKLADVVKHWVERASMQGDKIEVELSEVQATPRYESIDATDVAYRCFLQTTPAPQPRR